MTITSINIKRHMIEPFRQAIKEYTGFFDINSETAHEDGSVTVILHALDNSYLFYLGAMTQVKREHFKLTPP